MRRSIDPPGADWRRVSPRLVGLRVAGCLLWAAAAGAAAALTLPGEGPGLRLLGWSLAAAALAWLVAAALSFRRLRAIGYRLDEDDLLVRGGIMFERIVCLPYSRVQTVHLQRGPVERLAGLSTLSAASASASARLRVPGLPAAEARALRDRIVALAETRRAGA